MIGADPHSYRDPAQPAIRHIEFDFQFDFRSRTTVGRAHYTLDRPGSGSLFLDTHAVEVKRVQSGAASVPWALDAEDAILGHRLTLQLPAGASEFEIEFQLPPQARALQWMEPSQTAELEASLQLFEEVLRHLLIRGED